MEFTRKVKRIFAGALVVSLLLGGAAAEDGAFSFRSGITWDTSPAQMLAAEGLAGGGYEPHEENGYAYYYVSGQDVYYVYRGETLLQAYTALPADAYAAELERQSARYGAAADVSAETVEMLLNILIADTAIPGSLSPLTAWRLPDGTLAALFILNGKTFMVYFNEQRILGGE